MRNTRVKLGFKLFGTTRTEGYYHPAIEMSQTPSKLQKKMGMNENKVMKPAFISTFTYDSVTNKTTRHSYKTNYNFEEAQVHFYNH